MVLIPSFSNALISSGRSVADLLQAKGGQGNNLYWQPLYYTDHEFAQIIETIAAVLEKPVDKSQESLNQRLPWKGTMKDLTELIKALSLTALASTPETEIVQIFESIFFR